VLLAGDWRVTGSVLKIARRIWEVGVAGWPATGCRWGGVLDITAAAWTAGFQWWRSGDITRMQNVSEYMLVLTLCLVAIVFGRRNNYSYFIPFNTICFHTSFVFFFYNLREYSQNNIM